MKCQNQGTDGTLMSTMVRRRGRPTKFFCALEHHNYINKTIQKLKTNEKIVTNQKEILIETRKLYEKLFKNNDEHLIDAIPDEIVNGLNLPILTETSQN